VNLLGVAVIGAGYWGPNLVRNFSSAPGWDLRWVCDLDEDRARKAVGRYSTVPITRDVETVLTDDSVAAIAIATPAGTHAELAIAAMEAGKHVMVEKPLASSVAAGEKMVAVADEYGLVLMCDHTYCYTPVVHEIRKLIDSGELGRIQYVDSVRINLGLVQRDVNVLWDLAPHDLSILDYILPAGSYPTAVSAQGCDPVGVGQACIGYMTLPLAGGGIAHSHVNWLSPTKIRTTIVGGSRRMIVWDDLSPTQRLSVYDKGLCTTADVVEERRRDLIVSYRSGDMVAPAFGEKEALQAAVSEFRDAINERRPAATDGHAGLRVLRILEAASSSLENSGQLIQLQLGEED
jgi:predicted dehydrogenase